MHPGLSSYLYSSTSWRVLLVGGGYGNGSNAGLFGFHADYSSSNAGGNIGARLLDCKPSIAQAFPHRLVKILPEGQGLVGFGSNRLEANKDGRSSNAEENRLPLRPDVRP